MATVISVSAPDAMASPLGPDPAVFRLLRAGGTNAALSVNYVLAGSAVPGADYTLWPEGATSGITFSLTI